MNEFLLCLIVWFAVMLNFVKWRLREGFNENKNKNDHLVKHSILFCDQIPIKKLKLKNFAFSFMILCCWKIAIILKD